MSLTSLERPALWSNAAGKNRRAYVRYSCAPATAGRLWLAADNEYQLGWVANLSRGGVGLQLAKRIDAGSHAVLLMSGGASKKTYEFNSHVIHATEQPNGEWIVGLEFVRELSVEELDDLLA
jgi:hypothetical protein